MNTRTKIQTKLRALRQVEAALGSRTAAPSKEWSDGDPRAPKTPWGPAQFAYEIAPGVVWFVTAGHGGLRVAPAVAKKMLTPAAIKLADKSGGSFWYEEDEGYLIPFYENPDWALKYNRISGGGTTSKEELGRQLRSAFPQYFKMIEDNFVLPDAPKVGDRLLILKDIPYGRKRVPAGETVPVIEVRRSNLVFRYNGTRWALGLSWIDQGYAKLLPSGQRTANAQNITKQLPGGWTLTWNPQRPDKVEVDGDDWSDSALRYKGGKIVYDSPERIPSGVKGAVERFFATAKRQYTKMLRANQ